MCRELEKWSMEERQEGLVEGQRKGEDNRKRKINQWI